jgi:adenylate cyclase
MICAVRLRPSNPDAPARTVQVPAGTTLLEAVRRAGLPIARACDGGGLCARCGVAVLSGAEMLAPASAAETAAKWRNRVPAELRLACRVEVRGPLEITASYW